MLINYIPLITPTTKLLLLEMSPCIFFITSQGGGDSRQVPLSPLSLCSDKKDTWGHLSHFNKSRRNRVENCIFMDLDFEQLLFL